MRQYLKKWTPVVADAWHKQSKSKGAVVRTGVELYLDRF